MNDRDVMSTFISDAVARKTTMEHFSQDADIAHN